MDRDPQLRARDFWARMRSKENGNSLDVVLDGPPNKLSRTPGYVAAPGPLLGEDTEAVLSGLLNYSPTKIAKLREEQVIATQAEIQMDRS